MSTVTPAAWSAARLRQHHRLDRQRRRHLSITAGLSARCPRAIIPSGFINGTLTVTQATPKIRWSDPSDIHYGTTLRKHAPQRSSGGVAARLHYSPDVDTVLGVGDHQH